MDSSTSETLSISPPPSSQNKISQPRRSIPFINYDPKKGFMISKDAEDFLASLNPDRKIGVISIVGKYRTGKSFFINRVLLNIKGDGFNVGSTVNACTKGIWIWNDVILPDVDSEHKDMDILVLDTEGFGDTEENTTHDSRIFLFSLLLCSFFIYNSVGNIDENALNGVSLIVNLAKGIQVKSAKGADQEEDPALYFPSFLWVVRDFALLLTDKGGVTIKDKEYLEKALDHQKGVSDGIESKNRLRRLFKHFFKDRDCCTLIRPMESETELQKINDKEDFEFREEFVEQLKVIRKKILKKVNPKVLNGKTFNGEMLLELTRVYIKTMNSGSLPNIDNAWQYLMKSESKKAMTMAIDETEKEISEFIKSPQPQDLESVKSIKSKLHTQMFSSFRRKALGESQDIEEMMNSLNQDFKQKFKKVKECNMSAWKVKYQEFCTSRLDLIEEKLKHQSYSSYFEFQNEFNKLKEDFEKNGPKGPNKEEFFKEVSEKLHNMAAEHISRKSENILTTETRKLTLKLEMTEKDLNEKKTAWESEKISLEKRLAEVEREKTIQETKGHDIYEKYKKLKEENEELKKNIERIIAHNKEKETHHEQKIEEYKKKVEIKFENVKNEHSGKILELEKDKANLLAEITQLKKDNERLKEKLHQNEKEKEKITAENLEINKKNKKLTQKMEDLNENNSQAIATLKLSYEIKIRELSDNKEVSNSSRQQISELFIKNTFLENNIKQLENQLNESKRIYDNLFKTLQVGFENKGSNQNDSKDLFTMNRSLTQTIDSLEQRVKLFELKNQRLKNYKKIVSSSTIFRCSKCADFYSPQLFFDHVQNCFNYSNCSASPNTITSKDEVIKFDSAFKSNNELKLNSLVKINNKQDEKNKYLINQKLFSMGSFVENTPKIGKVRAELESLQEVDNRKNELKVSIRQTNVQNGEDKKPFTEYTIFCSLKRVKWRVTKKYVNFCQLHQELAMQYPNLNLKYSAYIVSNVSNFGGLFDPNKPMVLEEKRKGLENYLIEIASNEILKNSESFKKFLLIDDAVKKFSEPTKYSTPVQKSQEKIKDEKSVFISEKKNTDYSLIEKDNIACIPSLLEYANEKITISHNNDIFTISDVESSDKSSVLVLRF